MRMLSETDPNKKTPTNPNSGEGDLNGEQSVPGDIIVVRNSEILPSDGNGARLWRSGLIAKYFTDKGRKTRWIVASFDHYHKTQRDVRRLNQEPDIQGLVVLKTPDYLKNVSLARFKEHLIFGFKLYRHLRSHSKPSVIICSWPTPESSFFSVLYGRKYGVPVVLDIRDKWPDVMFDGQPVWKQCVFRLVTFPYWLMLKYSMKYADAVVGVNPDFLAWGKRHGQRGDNSLDFVSNIPFRIPKVNPINLQESDQILEKAKAKEAELLITFAGMLGTMFDFSPIFQVVEEARLVGCKLSFVICGDGGGYDKLRKEFQNMPEVLFTGRINSSTVFELLRRSDVLLACYQDYDNFRNHLPNKFLEYLAAGRPIVSSMQGLAKQILAENKAGATYSNAEELWEILSGYVGDRDRLEQEASNSKRLYCDRFNPDGILSSFEENMDKVVIEFYKKNSP